MREAVLFLSTALILTSGAALSQEKAGQIEQPDFWKFGFWCLSHFGRAC
jgi:hypothetical protein